MEIRGRALGFGEPSEWILVVVLLFNVVLVLVVEMLRAPDEPKGESDPFSVSSAGYTLA